LNHCKIETILKRLEKEWVPIFITYNGVWKVSISEHGWKIADARYNYLGQDLRKCIKDAYLNYLKETK
jgi:hypothetical protein